VKRLLVLALVATVAFGAIFSLYHSATSSGFNESSDCRFEIIEGVRVATDGKNIYLMDHADGDSGAPPLQRIRAVDGWSLTLNESLMVRDLWCFDGDVYAAGPDVVKIRDGKIVWVKNLVTEMLSYEGLRESPIPVYYEVGLDVLEMESDGEHLYLSTGDVRYSKPMKI